MLLRNVAEWDNSEVFGLVQPLSFSQVGEFGTGMVVVDTWLKFLALRWKIPGEDHFLSVCSVAFMLIPSGARKSQLKKKCRRTKQTELVSWARIYFWREER